MNGIFIREHAKSVSMFGNEVIVICAGRAEERFKRIYEVLDTIEEGIRTIRIYCFRSPFRLINYILDSWVLLMVARRLLKKGFIPQIIHAHVFTAGLPALILGRLYRIPIIISEHWSKFPSKELSVFEKMLAKFVMNRVDMILPVSNSLKATLGTYGIKGRFSIIPNVVDTSLFYPSAKRQPENREKKILFVGSLKPIKGLPFLFHALAQLRQKLEDWHLDIVGDGPVRSEYENMVGELRLSKKVIFHGMKSKKEVSEFMRKTDLFVLPSLAETFGIVAAEALATGVPVLATRCGGPEEFITDDVGMLVSPGSTDALCEGLDYMLRNLHLYSFDRIAELAHGIFSPEQVGSAIHRIYESLTSQDLVAGF
jgi:glycosyltransferase involved in cell wall biosynthesis